jgi:hypothetical protein
MTSSETTVAAQYFVDDLRGARTPGSRLHDILKRVDDGLALSDSQQDFLEKQGLNALLALARGSLSPAEFESAAQADAEARLAAQAAAREVQEAKARLWQDASDRKNAELFAANERKRARRKMFEGLGLGHVKREHFQKVLRIVRRLDGGAPLTNDDLTWLASEGRDYWTDLLRRAHHRIMAEQSERQWHASGDPWDAVNASAHWRKADDPSRALSVTGVALAGGGAAKLRSALLTTTGGALRDLRRHPEAVVAGLEAHELCPDDYRPCTLLGAVHIEMHSYVQGADWYAKAEERDASLDQVDREIGAILSAAPPDERDSIRAALKKHDPERFAGL